LRRPDDDPICLIRNGIREEILKQGAGFPVFRNPPCGG